MNIKLTGTMEITTVIGCKNMCDYCPQTTLIKKYKSNQSNSKMIMAFDDFKACLKKIPLNIRIDFSGMSEPWLNNHCTDMIRYAYERGYQQIIYTTLVGLKIEDIKLLEGVPFISFVVHLPNDKNSNHIPTDNRHMEKIQKLSESKIQNIGFLSVGGPPHPKIKTFLNRPIHNKTIISRADNLRDHTLKLDIEKRDRLFRDHLRGKINCSNYYSLLHHKQLNRNVLLPNGDVILCCMDYGLKHILGNLLTSDYQSLFQGTEYKKIQRGLDNQDIDIICRGCEIAVSRKKYFINRIQSRLKRYKKPFYHLFSQS